MHFSYGSLMWSKKNTRCITLHFDFHLNVRIALDGLTRGLLINPLTAAFSVDASD
jgi:hypothetical protein